MALITQASLTSGSSGTNGTSVATASISPTANRLVIVAVFGGAVTPANATDPSSVSGAGLTFTKLKAQNNTTTFGLNTSLWYAMSASPSTGAITITYANTQDLFIWSVFELAGVNVAGGTGSNAVNSNTASAQDITGTLTTLGTTLSAFGSTNNGAICVTINARATTAATATPDTGWTEIHDLSLVSGGIAFALETQWRDSNDTTPSETWSAAGAIQIVAAEIVAATSTGTLAKTNANDTLAAAGTTTVLGTLAKTNANDTLVASGSAGTPVSGTLATTNANDTLAGAGTTTVLGTLAKTNANDTSSASGTTTVLGALARTNANDASSASGSPIVNGSLAKTNANDTVAASGSVGSAVSGTSSTTNANDTLAASGTTTVLGSLARTNANDTSSGTGTTTVLGTLAYTNANDTVSASGAAGSITGTVAYTNNNDTLFATGQGPAPVFIVDTHDGFNNKKGGYDKYRKAKEKLRADIEAAFPQEPPKEIVKKVESIQARQNKPEEIAQAIQMIAEIQKTLESIIDEEETLMVLL